MKQKDMRIAGRVGVNLAPKVANTTVRIAAEQLTMMRIDDLVPYANNARVHDTRQISQLRASLREFGFVTPVLIDFDGNIIAGHGRVEAAKAEGMTEVPCVLVSSLTEAQRKAYILADNRLCETTSWDTPILKIELEGLSALNFDVGIAGFSMDDPEKIAVSAYERSPGGAIPDEQSEAEAIDLDTAVPTQSPAGPICHCPKCGFTFEVPK